MRIRAAILRIINWCFWLFSFNSPLKTRIPPVLFSSLSKTFQSIRIKKSLTAILGPQYTVNPAILEIDVTYRCFRTCKNCNRFLDILPSSAEISLEQIKKFIVESRQQKRRWIRILLSGGEPILHPEIGRIIELLVDYIRATKQTTELWLLTSTTKAAVMKALPALPPEIHIIDSQKDSIPFHHYPVTVALSDYPQYANADFCNACHVPRNCGIGFNAFGYYPCTTAAAIDRIFGFNVGIKALPPENYSFEKELRILCSRCGFFNRTLPLHDTVSPQWVEAINRYKIAPPDLPRY
ncbi:MAG TPA: 4Fe-4S cluster-binding domain-containing protein [Candidatus Omnitrophota bacterium]|nr:4Fe-4S cluster-binding domain-containing protein [Candidatus Omnitrophota bacterium]HPT07443.1 4Fe-4S cluster-binding domain-containing protein [Candidatus Omnitrophota bacterium]